MRLTAFPAANGDCFLVSFGSELKRHILVDGGRRTCGQAVAAHLNDLLAPDHTLELVVLTHIDADHVEGILEIAKPGALKVTPKDFWFNGFCESDPVGTLGFAQGDALSELLAKNGWPHNLHFGGELAHKDHSSAILELGEARLMLLGPVAEDLTRLNEYWRDWKAKSREDAGELPPCADDGVGVLGGHGAHPLNLLALAKPTEPDRSPSNRSSISLLIESEGARILLLGDAHADQLVKAIAPLAATFGGRLPVDLMKVSHHGSHKNTSYDLLRLIDCQIFFFSTDGSHHGHPDDQAVARIIIGSKGLKRLMFNYRTDRTEGWSHPDYAAKYGVECAYPDESGQPVFVDILARA